MRRLVWVFGWIGVAVWSLVCWATYGFFDLVGRLAMRNADALASNPDVVEGIWRVFSALHSVSTGVVLVIWALVSLLILAVPWVIDRMIGATPAATVMVRRGTVGPGGSFARPDSAGFARQEGAGFARQEGVIDLGPDQYSVRPAPGAGGGPSGPAPRIPPRP